MSEFYTILTENGLNKLIKASANQTNIVLSQMAVGDGTADPSQSATSLQNEKHKFAISSITQSPSDANVLIVEGVVSADVGGFYIREAGIFCDDGSLFAVAKLPNTYKPLLSEGSAKDLTISFYLQVSNAANIEIKVNNNVVLATRDFVKAELLKLDTKFAPLNHNHDERYAKKDEISDGTPIGAYLAWSLQDKIPAGYLLCDGRSLKKSEYAELFAVIGYIYGGSGDDFNIPKFNDGRFMRGIGGNAAALGVLQEDMIKKHAHQAPLDKGPHYGNLNNEYEGFTVKPNTYYVRANEPNIYDNGYGKPKAQEEYEGGIETRPLNSSVVFIIKAKNVREAKQSELDETPYATETKAGIVKLKNSITGNLSDTAVSEKAITDFITSNFANSKQGSGYTKLPNGLIFQWGKIGEKTNDPIKVTYPITFPNICLSLIIGNLMDANPNTTGGGGHQRINPFDYNKTGFTAKGPYGYTSHYLAIGY